MDNLSCVNFKQINRRCRLRASSTYPVERINDYRIRARPIPPWKPWKRLPWYSGNG